MTRPRLKQTAGALAIIMLAAPKGIWGYIAQRHNISLFPTGYRVHWKD